MAMNKFEKLVYDAVKKNPNIKLKVRNIYQSVFDLLPNKKDFSTNEIQAKEGYFFGFHDVSPFSFDDTKLLANRLTIPFRMPKRGDILEVGYFHFDGKMRDYVKIGDCHAWNYHKGCRLQWAGEDHVIYNDAVGDELVSQLCCVSKKQTKTIPFPIDSASFCGTMATSFSYGRLEKLMPGYGYAYEDETYNHLKVPSETGLFLGNLTKGTRELILSLDDLSKVGDISLSDLESHHYVTHSLFSPDNRYISFLHRWVNEDNVLKRWSRLVVYDLVTKKCHVAPTNDMVSHYVWNKKNQIVAYCRVGDIDSHVLFEEPTLQKFKRVAYPKLNSDGHQSFITPETFVTDTYPDKYRMANLYKVDSTSNETVLLARINSFKKFQSRTRKHWCCDLHPRMNRKGDVVCFDSVHTGERALCTMDIKNS
ncbi:hypothetical protein [Flagellimonas marina]|jgi:hypothetical protein|uniref:Uncharacterized protein n=1 Tax=Flagellimonas marina TaxID=1775168 RepID=A0ABV8PMW9_9FLAO